MYINCPLCPTFWVLWDSISQQGCWVGTISSLMFAVTQGSARLFLRPDSGRWDQDAHTERSGPKAHVLLTTQCCALGLETFTLHSHWQVSGGRAERELGGGDGITSSGKRINLAQAGLPATITVVTH